jgi:hypothetical protein
MSTAEAKPNKWRKRLWRLALTSTLLGTFFAVGVMFTAYIAVRLLFPLAFPLAAMGIVGIVSASAQATTNALYSGDSATRLTVLTQLQQTIDAEPSMTFDNQVSAWILPAIEQCKADLDPEVVSLAEQLATNIKARTLPPPQ